MGKVRKLAATTALTTGVLCNTSARTSLVPFRQPALSRQMPNCWKQPHTPAWATQCSKV